jgi:aspartyl-tRNA(Asn)/glutamyl-tRNA(Gln) amidotransferase subunit A
VVGLKPTAGLVNRSGVFPVSSTFDHVGPLARTVTDVALILQAIAEPPADYAAQMGSGLNGVKVGVPTSFFFDGISPEVENLVREAIRVLAGMGAAMVPLSWPQAAEAAEAVFTIVGFEAARLHRPWLDSRPQEYSPELRARLESGASIPQADYERARARADRLRSESLSITSSVDVVAAPANPVSAPRHGETHVRIGEQKLPIGSVMPRLGAPQNLTGCPAISIPCGFAATGVPVGLQLIGRPHDEATLLRVARAYEEATGWHRRRPAAIAQEVI